MAPNSVIEAIEMGIWDFEPEEAERDQFDATSAMPGTEEKLRIIASRVASGLPLWHPSDRRGYDDIP